MSNRKTSLSLGGLWMMTASLSLLAACASRDASKEPSLTENATAINAVESDERAPAKADDGAGANATTPPSEPVDDGASNSDPECPRRFAFGYVDAERDYEDPLASGDCKPGKVCDYPAGRGFCQQCNGGKPYFTWDTRDEDKTCEAFWPDSSNVPKVGDACSGSGRICATYVVGECKNDLIECDNGKWSRLPQLTDDE